MKIVLTIAGSDCSGGTGIQADMKPTGVYGIMDASPAFVTQQLGCVFTDIPPAAVKIDMASSTAIIEAIAGQRPT